MRSKIPVCAEKIKVTRLHDIIDFYRNGGRLEEEISRHGSSSGSYDYASYEDVKPESMDHPPIQHIDRMEANKNSREPIVHRASDFYKVPESSSASSSESSSASSSESSSASSSESSSASASE